MCVFLIDFLINELEIINVDRADTNHSPRTIKYEKMIASGQHSN